MSIIAANLIFSEKLHIRLFRHILLIVLLNALFIWVAFSRASSGKELVEVVGLVLFNSFFFFSYAYITAYILFPILLLKQRFFLFGVSFLVVGFLISYLKLLFSDYLFYDAIAAEFSQKIIDVDLVQVTTNTKDMTFIVAIFLIAKYAKDNYVLGTKLRELREKQLESEIKIYHNQLDPHVVFNNLNNLYYISLNNTEEALPNIRKLKSLLTYYFVESKKPKVLLIKELAMIEDYIGLEKLRYGERLEVEFRVVGEAEGQEIIPFVLFSFVENCFEHGCSIEAGRCWIKIDVEIRKNSLHFYAENSRPNVLFLHEKNEPDSSLDNMKRRLEILYPGKHYLVLKDEKRAFSVALQLKIA